MSEKVFIDFADKYYTDLEHPIGVAKNFDELSDEWIVSLFHDILEDTNVETNILKSFLDKYGKGHLIENIIEITRTDSETYFEYIDRIKKYNNLTTVVKKADIEHNLSRTETLKPSLEKRYKRALGILNKKKT